MLIYALIHFFLVANVCLVMYLAWWYWQHRFITVIEPSSYQYMPARTYLPSRKIALLCPTVTPAVTRLHAGILDTLNRSERFCYTIDIFEGKHRNTTTRQHAQSMLSGDYTCFASSGVFSTQILQAEMSKSAQRIPLVFGNIAETENHIVQHPSAHEWTTGVLHERNMTNEIDRLSLLVPGPRAVLIVLPRLTLRWVEKDAQAITHALVKKDCIVHRHRLCSPNMTPITDQLDHIDMVIVLGYTLDSDQVSVLAQQCTQRRVTLYTTDIDAVTYGAAIGSGGGEHALGATMGSKMRLIIEQKLPVHHIPITTQTLQPTIHLNEKNCPAQGVALSDTALFIIKQGEAEHL